MTYAQIIDTVLQRLKLAEEDLLSITINRETDTVTVITRSMAKHKLAIPTEEPRPKRVKTIKQTGL